MKHTFGSAILKWALLSVILLLAAPSAAQPHVAPQWGYSLPTTFLPMGMDLSMLIWGPVDGFVNVTVNVQPFNYTVPVYSQIINLSIPGSDPNATVYRNVTIPMANLGAETVRLCVTTDFGAVLGCPFITLTLANLTNLQQQLAWANLNWTIVTAREQSLFYAEQNLQGQIDVEFWVSVFLWGSLLFAVVVTRTGLAERRWGRIVREFFHRAFFSPTNIQFEKGYEEPRPRRPPANPERVFRGKAFPACVMCRIDQTEPEIVTHYRRDHGVDRPVRGLDYDIFRQAVKAATAKRSDIEPAESVLRDHLDRIPASAVDFSDLGKRT